MLATGHRKADVPLLDELYNDLVYALMLLHPDPRYNEDFVKEWLDHTERCVASGHLCIPRCTPPTISTALRKNS